MAKGDITSVTVAASGHYVSIEVEADAVDLDAYADYPLDPNGTPKVSLSLTRPAFTDAGVATTVADTIIGTYPVRKDYPNHADLDIVDNGGTPNTVTIKLFLSNNIFKADTSITADFTAGWFVNAVAGASSVAVNNAANTLLYPRPVGRWVTVPYQLITGSFEVEVAAVHRDGVAAVKFDCSDQGSNSIASQYVTTETWTNLATVGNGHACHASTIPVTALTALDKLDCNFTVFPKIGDRTLDCRVTVASGTHDGSANAGTLSDSGASFVVNTLIGRTVTNTTDGSSGVITANTATTVSAVLSGGTDNDWDGADAYSIAGDGLAQPSGRLGPLHMLNDKSGTYGVTFAYYSTTGDDGAGVSSPTEATARADPYLTIEGAAAGIKAYNNANYSRNTMGAGRIRGRTGTYDFAVVAGITGGNTDTWVTIDNYNGEAVTVGTGTNGNKTSTGFFKISGVTLAGSGVGTFMGNNTASALMWYDSLVDCTMSGIAPSYKWYVRYLTNSNITSWTDFGKYSANQSAWGIIQGNNFNNANTTSGFTRPSPNVFMGNKGDCRLHGENGAPDADISYAFIGYNTNRGDKLANIANFVLLGAAGAPAMTTGIALVCNIFDPQTAGTTACVLMWGDSADGNSENIIYWFNTVGGERNNMAYNDNIAAPTHKLWSVKYNQTWDFNCKDGVDESAATYVNNWSVLNGVGHIGNNAQDGGANAFDLEFGGLDYSELAPNFTDQAGGDYTPTGTNLYKGAGTPLIPFDINGAVRSDLWAGAVTVTVAVGGIMVLRRRRIEQYV